MTANRIRYKNKLVTMKGGKIRKDPVSMKSQCSIRTQNGNGHWEAMCSALQGAGPAVLTARVLAGILQRKASMIMASFVLSQCFGMHN